MKTYNSSLFFVTALIAGCCLALTGRVTAQVFTTLHSFHYPGGSDGNSPLAGLILSGNTLYGTAYGGGGSDDGVVFAVNANGTGFVNVHTFRGSDGRSPTAGLILSGNTLYGTASQGGSSYSGTVFAVNINGTDFTILHNFPTLVTGNNLDGASPNALILSGNTLYGTACGGGSSGYGTVFKVSTNGMGFTTLHSFTGSDGSVPSAGLILSSNSLYGTTTEGGSSGKGTVFKINTDGTGFTTLYSFTLPFFDPSSYNYINSGGASPHSGLILSGNTLYGTAYEGGSSGKGTVFKINTDGTGFTTLYSFTPLYAPVPGNNLDGAYPQAGLILYGNTLYGTASQGGSSGYGTVFKVSTNGMGFTTLHTFTDVSDGANPYASLILSGNTLYGTAYGGGSSLLGTVFSLSLGSVSAPQVMISRSAADVVLIWPTNSAGFTLQSTTNIVSSEVWTTVSAGPVVVNGQNTVTNRITGSQQFFRLISN
jgi:uncharacterized repeat protein (TIGR03803 family)